MIRRKSSGKLWHYDCASLPSGWTIVTSGGGSITQSGSTITINSNSATSDVAFLIKDDPLTFPCVVRSRSRATALTTGYVIQALSGHDSATKPTSSFAVTNKPGMGYYRAAADAWWSYWVMTGGATNGLGINTYYCPEIYWDGTNCVFRFWADGYGGIHRTQTQSPYSYNNSAWLFIGDHKDSGANRGSMEVDYIQAMSGLTIKVEGLKTGQAVALYDSDDNLIATAVESLGTATLNLSGVAGFDTNTNPDTASGGFSGEIRIYSSDDYEDVIGRYRGADIWGGDVYEYVPDIKVVSRPKPMSPTITISSFDGSNALSMLHEHVEPNVPSLNVYEALTFETCNPGGFTVARFTLHRDVTQPWEDLAHRNRVIITCGPFIFWEGYIDTPSSSQNPDTIEVECLGWSSQLNQLGTTKNITAGAGGYKLSTFLKDVVLADPDILIVEGDIETDDYAYPAPTRFEFAPYTTYFDAIEKLNAGNNYDWGVWDDRALDFKAKTPGTVDWLVYTGDCTDITIRPNPEALCNYVIVTYTQDGVHQQTVVAQDADSQSKYGVIKKTLDVSGRIKTDGATQIANTYISEVGTLRVSAEFTCVRVFDSNGIEHHLGEVRAGDNIRLVDWYPMTPVGEEAVDDITTFQIKSTSYDHSNYSLRVTPTEFMPSVEIRLARQEARGY